MSNQAVLDKLGSILESTWRNWRKLSKTLVNIDHTTARFEPATCRLYGTRLNHSPATSGGMKILSACTDSLQRLTLVPVANATDLVPACTTTFVINGFSALSPILQTIIYIRSPQVLFPFLLSDSLVKHTQVPTFPVTTDNFPLRILSWSKKCVR